MIAIAAAQPDPTPPPHRCSERELVEHVARYAAERGDSELESLCDSALAGETDEQVVLAAIRDDDELAVWVERGLNTGWVTRSGAPVVAPFRAKLDAALAAFAELGVERLSVTDHNIGGEIERMVSIEGRSADDVARLAAALGAPRPIDKIADHHTWLSSRIEEPAAHLTITVVGAWRRVPAA